jgi:RecB family exonuclease
MTAPVLDGAVLPALEVGPLPDRESYSSLSLYEGCPRRYAFRYVARLPGHVPPGRFAFGSAIHRAFEVYIREHIGATADGTQGPSLETFRDACDEVLDRASLEPDELAHLRAAAGPILECFLRREKRLETTPVAVELGFGVDVPLFGDGASIRFVGYLDRVDRAADGSTVITDYKTGRTRSQAEVDADRQLTAYAYAAARGALIDPASGEPLAPASRLCLYFADEGIERWTTRTPADLSAFERDLIGMAIAARERRFDPRPERWRCSWCEYHAHCADAILEGYAIARP